MICIGIGKYMICNIFYTSPIYQYTFHTSDFTIKTKMKNNSKRGHCDSLKITFNSVITQCTTEVYLSNTLLRTIAFGILEIGLICLVSRNIATCLRFGLIFPLAYSRVFIRVQEASNQTPIANYDLIRWDKGNQAIILQWNIFLLLRWWPYHRHWDNMTLETLHITLSNIPVRADGWKMIMQTSLFR